MNPDFASIGTVLSLDQPGLGALPSHRRKPDTSVSIRYNLAGALPPRKPFATNRSTRQGKSEFQ